MTLFRPFTRRFPQRLAAGFLAAALACDPLSLASAAPANAATGPMTDEAPVTTPTSAASLPAGGSTKDPLIEVSVDSLEISETNKNTLGFLWSDNTANNNQLHFIERSIPSIFSFGTLERAAEIGATLDALIQNDQARILANPTLVTKSGFEATFSVGGEIPYRVAGQGGVPGVEFKKYGVTLKILPQITPRKTIDAQINLGVSAPDASVAVRTSDTADATPGLLSREAGSKVEVNDGETVVLAGIKQSRRSKTTVRVPVLGYIPLLGLLFRHKEESVSQTSLVFFVTFRLVKS